VASKQDKPAEASQPAKGQRRLLGMMRGSDLFDENGELDEAAIKAFADELKRQMERSSPPGDSTQD